MALERMTGGATGLNTTTTKPLDGLQKGPQGGSRVSQGGPDSLEFKRALDQFSMPGAHSATKPQMPGTGTAGGLKFSNHSIERMHSRGIHFGADELKSIENAVTKAAAKGSKDTLVLSGDKALIVSVKNNTVVTVMDRAAMKENVFTNIDSTVVL